MTMPRPDSRPGADRPSPWLQAAALVVSIAALAGADAAAQDLSTVKRLACTFTSSAVGSWKDEAVEARIRSGQLKIEFASINADDGTAQIAGDTAASDIVVRLVNGNLHLMQIFREGGLYVTTVFPQSSSGGRLKAVHTRHEYTTIELPGFTSRPEQYYGTCSPE